MQTRHQIVAIVVVLRQFAAILGNVHRNIWRHFVAKGQLLMHDELLCDDIIQTNNYYHWLYELCQRNK